MNHGGRLALLGIPTGEVGIDMNQVIFKGLVLKGIYGREMFETWYKMTAMLTSGLDVSPVLTHRFAVEDYSKAFETMRSGAPPSSAGVTKNPRARMKISTAPAATPGMVSGR